MSLIRRRRRRTEINLVPLVDVLIVIIFFFVMTMQLRNPQVMNITPPKVETAGQNEAVDQVVIAVDAQGDYFYNNTPVDEAALLQSIQLSSTRADVVTVLVIADEDTPLKNVTYIMDMCRKHGLEKLRLQTR